MTNRSARRSIWALTACARATMSTTRPSSGSTRRWDIGSWRRSSSSIGGSIREPLRRLRRHLPMNGEEHDQHYGVKALPDLYREWSASGMVANIGTRLVEVDYGRLVLEGNMTAESHGFPTSRGPLVHGGAIATLADEALASVAFTVAEEGETTVTADLKIDFLRPAKPGRLVARATVRHRTRRLAFCEATVEQGRSEIVAEARAVIAYVKA